MEARIDPKWLEGDRLCHGLSGNCASAEILRWESSAPPRTPLPQDDSAYTSSLDIGRRVFETAVGLWKSRQ
jgi:hypothetical protein